MKHLIKQNEIVDMCQSIIAVIAGKYPPLRIMNDRGYYFDSFRHPTAIFCALSNMKPGMRFCMAQVMVIGRSPCDFT